MKLEQIDDGKGMIPPPVARRRERLNQMVAILARYELWLPAAAAPFLLFPNRWTPFVFLLIPLAWLLRRLATGRWSVATAMDAPIAVLVVMALISYLVSADGAMSWAKFWGVILQAAIFYALVNGLRRETELLPVAPVLMLATVVIALLSLVGSDWEGVRLLDLPFYAYLPRLIEGLPGSGVPRASELFSPRQVGGTMAMLLPVALPFFLFGAHWRWRLGAAVTLLIGGLVLLLSQAVGALFGFGLALFLIAAWHSRWFLLAAPAGALALVAFVDAYGPARLALRLLSVNDLLGVAVVLRLDMWSRSLAMIRDMPYTGIGMNTFPHVQAHFYPGFLLGPNEVNAHNLFLQTALDLGIPGLLAFLWLLAAFYLTVSQAYRLTSNRNLQLLLVGLAAGTLAYLGNGLPDTITLGAKPAAAVWAMWGVAAACLAVARGQQAAVAPPPAGRAGRGRLAYRLAALLLPLLLLLMSVLLLPAALPRNLGAVAGQRAILTARTGGGAGDALLQEQLQSAAVFTNQALNHEPGNAQSYALLGSLYAWQGDQVAAVAALERRVTLDGRNPMATYAPFETLRRQLVAGEGHNEWDDLIRVYTHWNSRYPDRAEGYVQLAVVWQQHKGNPARATSLIQSGLERGAEPRDLLIYYLEKYEPVEP